MSNEPPTDHKDIFDSTPTKTITGFIQSNDSSCKKVFNTLIKNQNNNNKLNINIAIDTVSINENDERNVFSSLSNRECRQDLDRQIKRNPERSASSIPSGQFVTINSR
jgi:hypothetical protein